MISIQDLMNFGYTQQQAEKIRGNTGFKIKDSIVFKNKLKEIEKVYNTTREKAIKAVLSSPSFAGFNHERVLRDVTKIYGVSRQQAIKAVLCSPKLADLKHERVLRDVTKIYGVSRQQAIKAIITYPPFAGLDHGRVLRQKLKTGKALGLNKKQVLDIIFSKPVTAGTSFQRDFAYARALQHEGIKGLTKEQLIEFYKKNYIKSPYVRAKVKLSKNEPAKEMKFSIRNYKKLSEKGLIEGTPKTGKTTAWNKFKAWKNKRIK